MTKRHATQCARYLSSVAAAAIVLSGGSAMAQATTDDGFGLEEIIVTARKVEENLQDVPVAVTVLSGEQLEARSVVRVQDIGRFTPGIPRGPVLPPPAR